MALLLKNARCVDPQVELDAICDVLVRDGQIAQIGKPGTVDMAKGVQKDLSGRILIPGMMDMHVHLREPGYEYKEDVASGSRAAAKGGFTAVLCMPNTKPVINDATQVAYVIDKAQLYARTNIYVAGALSHGLKGEALSEMGDMVSSGAIAFTDDGRGVQDSGMMRRAMDYAKQFNVPVLSHCQDEGLVANGVVNEGLVSTRLGLASWPAAGEEIQIARDIALCEITGCALHVQHISTARGVDLVRAAKNAGLPVTCEVTPHHLFLCEDDLDERYDTNLKMNPPLRTRDDMLALQTALTEGIIDCVATDHAPHAAHEKALEFELAPFGTIGLETALGLVYGNLVAGGKMTLASMIARMSVAPRRILGLQAVRLEEGNVADLTIFNPDILWTVRAEDFCSKSKNSAFLGLELKGRATDVYVEGYASLEDGKVVD
ncbi:MAG: dihydroorotase [Coriobacteriales bacterium]|jgi:dihydroorotase|nr:dihydroorotase [Coriobacteriales bacterium]